MPAFYTCGRYIRSNVDTNQGGLAAKCCNYVCDGAQGALESIWKIITGESSHSGCIPPSPKLSTFFQASRCRGSHDVQEGRENKTGTGDCEEPKALSVETPNWMAHNHNWLICDKEWAWGPIVFDKTGGQVPQIPPCTILYLGL